MHYYSVNYVLYNCVLRQNFVIRRTPLGRTISRERNSNSTSSNLSGVPWRRSVSRDLASDIESVLSTPGQSATLPRGGN